MSLRTVFTLLGLAVVLLCSAVVWFRFIDRPERRAPTFAERRALTRVCDTQCGGQARRIADESSSDAEVMARARACMEECRRRQLAANGFLPEE